MTKLKIQYKSAALLIFFLLLLKGLFSAIYYYGTNDFMDINGFRLIEEIKVDWVNIVLQISFIFFTIMSYIKREEIDFKIFFITMFSVIIILQYAMFFNDNSTNSQKGTSSVYLEDYPTEIDEIIEQEFDLKNSKLKNIEVLHPYIKVTNGEGMITFEGVNYSMYRVFVIISNFKDAEEVYDEKYTMTIDTSFNLMFKYLNENYIPIENKPKKWEFETLKKNLGFF